MGPPSLSDDDPPMPLHPGSPQGSGTEDSGLEDQWGSGAQRRLCDREPSSPAFGFVLALGVRACQCSGATLALVLGCQSQSVTLRAAVTLGRHAASVSSQALPHGRRGESSGRCSCSRNCSKGVFAGRDCRTPWGCLQGAPGSGEGPSRLPLGRKGHTRVKSPSHILGAAFFRAPRTEGARLGLSPKTTIAGPVQPPMGSLPARPPCGQRRKQGSEPPSPRHPAPTLPHHPPVRTPTSP